MIMTVVIIMMAVCVALAMLTTAAEREKFGL
jgi:hypothetical protein